MQKVRKLKQVEAEIHCLQTVKKKYSKELDYRTFWLANKTPKYNETISCHIEKLVKNVKSRTKAHYFGLKKPIFIIGFLPTFKHACGTNRFHKEAAMWVILQNIHETLDNALNGRMCAEERTILILALVRNNDTRSRENLLAYPEVVNFSVRSLQRIKQ